MTIQYASINVFAAVHGQVDFYCLKTRTFSVKSTIVIKQKKGFPNNALLVIVCNAGLSPLLSTQSQWCNFAARDQSSCFCDYSLFGSRTGNTVLSQEHDLKCSFYRKLSHLYEHFILWALQLSFMKICTWIIFKHVQLPNSLAFWFNNHASFTNDFSYRVISPKVTYRLFKTLPYSHSGREHWRSTILNKRLLTFTPKPAPCNLVFWLTFLTNMFLDYKLEIPKRCRECPRFPLSCFIRNFSLLLFLFWKCLC